MSVIDDMRVRLAALDPISVEIIAALRRLQDNGKTPLGV